MRQPRKVVRVNTTLDGDTILDNAVCSLMKGINTPRSLTVYIMWKHKMYYDLVNLTIDPLHYNLASAFADDYQATEFLKKHPSLETGIDTKRVAQEAFERCEEQCRITNKRIRSGSHSGLAKTIMSMARKRILNVLGEIDSDAMNSIFERAAWGKGTTSASKGKHLSVDNKLRAEPEATADLIAAGVHHLVNTIPAYSAYIAGQGHSASSASVTPYGLTAVHGNVVTYVPKNAKTDRPIAVEPHLNALLQKGIGSYMQSLLRRVGCNLRDQGVNQMRARKGSLNPNLPINVSDIEAGKLATIDLKSASDTVSEAVVEELVPHSWLRLFDVARSKMYKLDGRVRRYHKHSSMGNGYTFELETLIFDSLAKSVCEFNGISSKLVTTYGDDLIVPIAVAGQLIEVLNECGFQTNTSKTFITGPFRESCGQDFFDGVPVRPIYVRQELDNIASVIQLANAIRRRSGLLYDGLVCDTRYKPCWMGLFLSVPKALRFRCPEGYGDAGFIGSFDECATAVRSTSVRCWDGFRLRGLVFQATEVDKKDDHMSMISGLWDVERSKSYWDDLVEFLKINPDRRTRHHSFPDLDRTRYALRSCGRWNVRTLVYHKWFDCGAWA